MIYLVWFFLPLFSFIVCSTASAATLVNIRNARKHFEKLERLEAESPAPVMGSLKPN